MRLLFLLIPLIISGICSAQDPKQNIRLSAKEAKEDLAFLYETLQASHYNLFVNTEKEVFDKRFRELQASFTDSVDRFDFHRSVQKFTALAELAHCSSEYPFSTSYGPYLYAGGTLFPFSLYVNAGKVYLTQNYSGNLDIKIGSELISINQLPIKTVMTDIYGYISGESTYLKNSVIDLIEFARLYWLVYGQTDSFELALKNPQNGENSHASVSAVLASEMEEAFAKKPSLFNLDREFYFLEKIAYLRPGIFLNKEVDLNTSEQNTFDKTEFTAFIDSSFKEIKQNNAQHLIIDLRGNSGGDNSFSDIMLAYFADKPFWFCSQFHVRTSELTKKFWEDVETENLQEMRKQILSHENGERFEAAFENYQPNLDSLRYTGEVYVLIDRYSFSNTVSTAAIIKDYGFGTLLGEITADIPTSFGAVHQFNLPHTQIAITYPKAFIIRPNGSESLIGVKPDIPLQEIRGNGKDDMLEQTLNYIKNKAN